MPVRVGVPPSNAAAVATDEDPPELSCRRVPATVSTLPLMPFGSFGVLRGQRQPRARARPVDLPLDAEQLLRLADGDRRARAQARDVDLGGDALRLERVQHGLALGGRRAVAARQRRQRRVACRKSPRPGRCRPSGRSGCPTGPRRTRAAARASGSSTPARSSSCPCGRSGRSPRRPPRRPRSRRRRRGRPAHRGGSSPCASADPTSAPVAAPRPDGMTRPGRPGATLGANPTRGRIRDGHRHRPHPALRHQLREA